MQPKQTQNFQILQIFLCKTEVASKQKTRVTQPIASKQKTRVAQPIAS